MDRVAKAIARRLPKRIIWWVVVQAIDRAHANRQEALADLRWFDIIAEVGLEDAPLQLDAWRRR